MTQQCTPVSDDDAALEDVLDAVYDILQQDYTYGHKQHICYRLPIIIGSVLYRENKSKNVIYKEDEEENEEEERVKE
jgi:hypothetical protein